MNQPFHPAQMPMLTTDKAKTLHDIIARWKVGGERIALVPTMGALHEGHLSLIRIAQNHADKVVVSIFVNPTQFAPHEDFQSYPRNLSRDLKQLQDAGVDLAYTPDEHDIYPDGPVTTALAGSAAEGLESDARPHFFDGVASVVKILLEQTAPDIAIFGEKDFQQLMVIREMVTVHNLPVEIIGGPIIRDSHGLALSSRNAYLCPEELEIAQMMNQIIYKAAFDLQNGTPEISALEDAKQALLTCGFDHVDYVTYKPEWNRVLAAARLSKTRLIDNCLALPDAKKTGQ